MLSSGDLLDVDFLFGGNMKRLKLWIGVSALAVTVAFQNCGELVSSVGSEDGSSYDSEFVSKCVPSNILPKVQMHRLSNKEYQNIVADLFGRNVATTSFPLADATGVSGFSNDYARMNNTSYLADEVLAGYYVLAMNVAKDVMANNPNSVLNLACKQNNDNCNGTLIENLAMLVFRRPLGSVTGDMSKTGLLTLFKSQNTRAKGVELVLTTLLGSPSFLYRSYGSFTNSNAQAVDLNNYEMASRLSFFLWASAPDVALLNANLADGAILDAQIDRMLASTKAKRLSTLFGDEWTKYTDVTLSPVPSEFGVSDTIATQAVGESREFINHVFVNSTRLLDIVDANYSYLNSEMADFYGINGVSGNNFQLVPNLGEERGGLLTHMSLLSPTSGGDTDSHPVRRGLWVAKDIMCIPLNAPPDGVDTEPDIPQAKTPAEFAEYHSATPACMGCHRVLDPIGLGMENYDAIGQWRTMYTIGAKWGGKNIPVQPEGSLTGVNFSGPAELKKLISKDPRTHACISEKIMSYAIGRSLASVDHCESEKIGQTIVGNQGSFREVVKRVVRSNAFSKGGR